MEYIELKGFEKHLTEEEKSAATIEKYMRDVRYFLSFAGDREIDKTLTIEYKSHLEQNYAIVSANSMIAALNCYLRYMGMDKYYIRQFKIQKQIYCSEEKELTKAEYIRLVSAAKERGSERLSLLIETICGTGIRVSELQFVTVEAANRSEAVVSCKGKRRSVFIQSKLKKKLLKYAKAHEITSGAIFITKTGKPMNRSNIWKEMKSLCERAGVNPGKVFPHNLRHLFARTFYSIDKDIAKLADILGHSSIDTTRIYIISTGMEHRRRIERMRLVE